ncbi:MAG: polysaccharide biosynthesis tyrosine autokinase [Calothrix sp. C42_A2020_038]|nr:polysaccharide biosynthesis tyrosine autokinase [Calothrix sp. C42_A2020_038]
MESLPTFEEVDFQKYLQVLQRRWLPLVGILGVCTSSGTLYALSLKPSYKAEGSLMIKSNRTSSLTGLTQDLGRLEALGQNDNPLETQVKVVTSNPVIQETIRSLQLEDGTGQPMAIPEFSSKLKVEGLKGSDVIQISYKDNDPKIAAKVVNKLIDTYIKLNVDANRNEATSAKAFIVQQLPVSEEKVRKAEFNLRVFKEKNQVVVLQQEAAAAVDKMSKLEEQISQAQAQLVDVEGRLKELNNQTQINSPQAVIASDLSQTPGIQKVLGQLQELEAQLELERTRFKSSHPAIVTLEEKVATLRNLLRQRTQEVAGGQQIAQENLQIGQLRQSLIADIARNQAQRIGLKNQIAILTQQWRFYKAQAQSLPRLEQMQRDLERNLKAAQTTYETLLTKVQEISVAENQKIANARVISYALVPGKPEGPRKTIFVIAGGALGLFLGVIAAFGLDLVDRSVKTVKEAKEVMKYTLLGVIPAIGKNNHSVTGGVDRNIPKIIGRDVAHYPLGDAYQILQANLKFLCSDKPLKSIVVTSAVAKEGKSEVAANLAVAMAQIGRRVLLVDGDMRQPIQHHVWNLTNAVGLTNVIVDQVALESAVQEVLPNLDVLSCGVLPPNPMALLDSQRMASLVESFHEKYDCVIFDTPAISGTADAAVLSQLADGMLLVVRPGVVDLDSANATKEFLTQSGQKVLGIVINGVNVKKEPDSYFYYTKARQIEQVSISSNLKKMPHKPLPSPPINEKY